ncbi:MAG: DUF1015 domain-containing protein [Deltaproteobacteria bacterium]
MAVVIPFKGIRYNTDKVGNLSSVTTPPYDIISPEAQEEFYTADANNIIRIELGKDFDGDNESSNKYTRAGKFLSGWLDQKILVREDSPAIYIYEQDFKVSEWETKTRRGIIALVKLADFSEGIVLPHEYTLSKAKQDRFNLMSTTDANISQIFSLYNDEDNVSKILDSFIIENKPDIEYVNSEGINERLWVIKDTKITSEISRLFEDKKLFIADGHHRYETALNYRNKKASENPSHNGSESYNYVMMTIVDMDDPGLVVFPTHRALSFENFNSEAFLAFLNENFKIQKIEYSKSFDEESVPEQLTLSLSQSGEFGKSFGYFDGLGDYFYILTLKDISIMEKLLPDKPEAYRTLDVAILHSSILEQYFNIDAENMAEQKNLTYVKSPQTAFEGVKSRKYDCVFFLNPTKVSEMRDVSLANEKMPQKSTYFYPKVTTGLVINKF